MTEQLSKVTNHVLQEAASETEIRSALDRLMSHDIPGFVVRAAYSDENSDDSHQVAKLTEAHISERYIPGFTINDRMVVTQEAGDERTSSMHTDGRAEGGLQGPVVHITREGEGKVVLASPGAAFNQAHSAGDEHEFVRMWHEADDGIRRGMVKPSIVRPEAHSAEITEGDAVVFRVGNEPTLHQFDNTNQQGRVSERYAYRAD